MFSKSTSAAIVFGVSAIILFALSYVISMALITKIAGVIYAVLAVIAINVSITERNSKYPEAPNNVIPVDFSRKNDTPDAA